MTRDIGKIAQSVTQVERLKREKREKFLELFNDPDCADLVQQIFDVAVDHAAEALEQSQTGSARNSSNSPVAHIRPGVQTGIKKEIIELKATLPAQFNINHVQTGLMAKSFRFGSDPKSAIRDALYNMSNGSNPTLRIVRRGEGGLPNIYEFLK